MGKQSEVRLAALEISLLFAAIECEPLSQSIVAGAAVARATLCLVNGLITRELQTVNHLGMPTNKSQLAFGH